MEGCKGVFGRESKENREIGLVLSQEGDLGEEREGGLLLFLRVIGDFQDVGLVVQQTEGVNLLRQERSSSNSGREESEKGRQGFGSF